MFKKTCLEFLIVSIALVGFHALPVRYSSGPERVNVFGNYSSDKLITFMQTFGYLQEPVTSDEGLQAEFLYAEEAVIDGIKSIQKYGAIEQTGVLNQETIQLLSAPRCGVKDVLNSKERQKRYIIGSKNWEKRLITYYVANWSHKVEEAKMVKWLEQGFDAWAKYSRLKFKRVFDPSADIIIAFGSLYHGDRYPFDGPGRILAHAYYPYEENAFGGDIHFDNDENWKENATNLNEGVDFLTVFVHELGHSLGLAHSPVWNSVMFPYYKGVTAQLEYDDILALYTLYITKTLQENGEEEADSSTTANEDSNEVHESVTSKTEDEVIETEGVRVDSDNENEVDTTNDSGPVPDLCEGSFDAVSYVKEQIYVLKGNYIWQFDKQFQLEESFPKKISQVFPNLPKRFKKIDAVYEIPDDDEIVFFSGGEYITYDIRGPIYSAYNITRYTYDPEIEKIDAAMIWSKNNRTYLFSADRFWKYSEKRQMDMFYPRIMARWNGIPESLDAAISIPSGPTIFFKGSDYWVFDDQTVRPKVGYPSDISNLFDYCHE